MNCPAKVLKDALAIAARLYKADREAYKPLFAWINAQTKRRASPALILEVVKALERLHEGGHKPREIHKYLNGIARSIKEHKAARDLRAGQTNWISDILGKAMLAATSSPSPSGRGKSLPRTRSGGEGKR